MISLIRILLVLVVLISAASIAPARAQDVDLELAGVENAAPAAIPSLAVAENVATAEFPEGITFSLDAEASDPIVNLELLYRAPGLETLSVELPPFEAGATEVDIDHPIDLRSGELPAGVDVQYRWRITEDDGDVIETPEQTLLWSDDRYDWTPLSGENVTIYTYDADPIFQQAILDTAERTIAELALAYGADLDQPVRVWVYAAKEDLYGALNENSVSWIAGGTYGALHLIHLTLPPDNYGEVERVLPHEISHQMMHLATANPYNGAPFWLEEGMAVYSQLSGRVSFYSQALEVAGTGHVPSLRTLNGDAGYEHDEALAAYALSLSVVMYIIDTWGHEGIARLLAAFPEGVTYEDAVQQGLGISFDELDRQWREDLIADAQHADAQQSVATGSTRFGADDGASPWSTIGEGLALASGTVILGLVVLFAVIAGLFSFVRSRRHSDEDEPVIEGVHWSEWPEGLEPPGWQARSASKP